MKIFRTADNPNAGATIISDDGTVELFGEFAENMKDRQDFARRTWINGAFRTVSGGWNVEPVKPEEEASVRKAKYEPKTKLKIKPPANDKEEYAIYFGNTEDDTTPIGAISLMGGLVRVVGDGEFISDYAGVVREGLWSEHLKTESPLQSLTNKTFGNFEYPEDKEAFEKARQGILKGGGIEVLATW